MESSDSSLLTMLSSSSCGEKRRHVVFSWKERKLSMARSIVKNEMKEACVEAEGMVALSEATKPSSPFYKWRLMAGKAGKKKTTNKLLLLS